MTQATVFDKYESLVGTIDTIKYSGVIDRVQGLLLESVGPQAVVGEVCRIELDGGARLVPAEVIGLSGTRVQLMAYEDTDGIEVGCTVIASGEVLRVPVGDHLLGRVIDGLGRPIDEKGEVHSTVHYPVNSDPPNVLNRRRITSQIETGVRAIDGMVPVGNGQRMGIFSGSGVGKSTLLGMIARNTNADVNVIALIGERGREVREFIENDLGPEGLERSVLVVATSDSSPLARFRAAGVATAVAEYFRDEGRDVMFLFDSVTRYARAVREISLARGEFPANRGFTPSVFSGLPKLLERCGTSDVGTMTGFYTILVEGDDMDEPIADTVRGILDGHLVLSRRLAQRAHYPAIDVLASISRLEPRITESHVKRAIAELRRLMAVYNENEDIINIGAYATGSQPEIDRAIARIDRIREFLQQQVEESASLDETQRALCELAEVPYTDPEIRREPEDPERSDGAHEPGASDGAGQLDGAGQPGASDGETRP